MEIPFDSTRKRMSVIVKPKGESENVYVMTKGADNIIIPRCRLTQNQKNKIKAQLYNFSCEGLRTLVLGQKTIEKNYFNTWYEKYNKYAISTDENKDIHINDLFNEIEIDLQYVGSTAIEDKLQDVSYINK